MTDGWVPGKRKLLWLVEGNFVRGRQLDQDTRPLRTREGNVEEKVGNVPKGCNFQKKQLKSASVLSSGRS